MGVLQPKKICRRVYMYSEIKWMENTDVLFFMRYASWELFLRLTSAAGVRSVGSVFGDLERAARTRVCFAVSFVTSPSCVNIFVLKM